MAAPSDALIRTLPAIEAEVRDRIIAARASCSGKIVFTTSFGLEDQVLTALIARSGLGSQIVFATLDTGRLFPEVYDLWARTEEHYGIGIRGYAPKADDVEQLVLDQGINGFRASPDARKRCCAVRKLMPLDRALRDASGWITGLRAGQSQARAETQFMQHDAERNLLKINPLCDWSREQAADFARAHEVPLNPLHERGFLSIGCAPCTRAVAPGELERAGRWWWEQDAAKECGLHVGSDGRLARQAKMQAAS